MKRFTPAEIDQLLAQPAENQATASLPEDFFEQMEQRILAATVEAESNVPEVSPSPRRFRLRPLWAAAAAAVVLLVCTVAVKNLLSVAPQSGEAAAESYATVFDDTEGYDADDDLYALTPEADDNDLNDLDEIYEADLFLREL